MQDSFTQNSPAPPPLPTGSQLFVSEDDRTLGMLCHLLGIFTGFLGPLVLWLVKKDSSAYIDHHGRESLNFQITLFLVMMALGATTFVLMFVLVGVFLIPVIIVLQILAIVAQILAAVAAQNGGWHRYPFCMRLV
ncbi:MAG TPA: DUF4870 domain-containing protein [Luteolibacter sp.]